MLSFGYFYRSKESSPEKVIPKKVGFCDKKFGMTNDDNMDQEQDEVNIVWEKERDWSATYFRRNKIKIYKKNKGNIITEICNYRKPYNREGHLLAKFDDGKRDWAAASSVFHDAKNLVMDFMDNKKITTDMCAFGTNYKNPSSGFEDPMKGSTILKLFKRLHDKRASAKIPAKETAPTPTKAAPLPKKAAPS